MPQATDELRQRMKERFGSEVDDNGPHEYLKSKGYKLVEPGYWTHETRTYENMSAEEYECILFLAQEWDYGGLIP